MIKVKDGQKEFQRGGAIYVDFVCAYHRGEYPISEDEFSENTGFDSSCVDCAHHLAATVEHIEAVESHDAHAERVFGKAVRYGTPS